MSTAAPPEHEQVAASFVRLIREKGLANALEFIEHVERGTCDLPAGIKMSRREFAEIGRIGCTTYYNSIFPKT